MTSPSDSPRGKRADDGAVEAPADVPPPTTSSPSVAASRRFRLPGAAFVRARREGLRRTSAAVVGAAVAAAVLFASGGSLPRGGGVDYAEAPLRPYAAQPVAVTGQDITVDQVLGVLQRAHRLALDQGAAMDAQVAQAAAELGMLYTTYQAQQEAIRAAVGVLDPRDGSVIGRPPTAGGAPGTAAQEEPEGSGAQPAGDRAAGGGADAQDDATNGGSDPRDGSTDGGADETNGGSDPHDGEDDAEDDGRDTEDSAPATEVAHVPGLGGKALDDPEADGAGGTHATAETSDHDTLVTREDLVLAAQRLARLMDPSTADTLLVAPVPAGGTTGAAGGGDPALRRSLVSIVDAFGLSTSGFANGRIPVAVLCPLEFAPGHRLRCDAAERFNALNAEYEKEFGRSIPITDSYRTYESQVTLRALKPALAAIPGTSNHGWGLAVDLGVPINSGRSAEYHWLRVHGPDYGWDNPVWARLGGSKPEPWHFEFFAAGVIPQRAVDVSDVGTGDPRYRPPEKTKPGEEPAAIPAKDTPGSDDPGKDPGDGSTPSSKPPKPTPKPSPTPTPSPSPTESGGGPSPSPSPTQKPSPSPSPSQEPSPTPSPTPSEEPSPSPSPSQEPSPSPSPGDGADPAPAPEEPGEETGGDPEETDESCDDSAGTSAESTDADGAATDATGSNATDDDGTGDATDSTADDGAADDGSTSGEDGACDAPAADGAQGPSSSDAAGATTAVVTATSTSYLTRRRPDARDDEGDDEGGDDADDDAAEGAGDGRTAA